MPAGHFRNYSAISERLESGLALAVVVSNPLNEQITKLLIDIVKLERDREQHQDALENPTSTQLVDELIETKRHRLAIEALTREIDLRRQELISLELLVLDNSIKSLQSTTSQVDTSINSLQTTTSQLLKSSTKLEWLTTLLIYITVLLAIIGVYNLSIVFYPSNPPAGLLALFGSIAALIYLFYKLFSFMSKKKP